LSSRFSRRTALGLGTVAAAGTMAAVGSTAWAGQSTPSTASATPTALPGTRQDCAAAIRKVYQEQKQRAGGTWSALISVANPDGSLVSAADDSSDTVVQAYSVNKVAVATVLLDKVDRGLLTLDQRVDVTADIVIPGGDGIFSLDGAYPSSVTLGHVLAALLTVSDDTAVRLCGLLTTSVEINQVLTAKGFPNTQVEPVANPHRFFLGTTTPLETHNLLQSLLATTALSATSSGYLFELLRSPIAYTDGIRRTMSSDERSRIATKAGWFADGRNEAGVIFDTSGRPVLTYAMFCSGITDPDDFGATNSAVQARATMGRSFLDVIDKLSGTNATRPLAPSTYRPVNGG
jgi:beta-lactamase class A